MAYDLDIIEDDIHIVKVKQRVNCLNTRLFRLKVIVCSSWPRKSSAKNNYADRHVDIHFAQAECRKVHVKSTIDGKVDGCGDCSAIIRLHETLVTCRITLVHREYLKSDHVTLATLIFVSRLHTSSRYYIIVLNVDMLSDFDCRHSMSLFH